MKIALEYLKEKHPFKRTHIGYFLKEIEITELMQEYTNLQTSELSAKIKQLEALNEAKSIEIRKLTDKLTNSY